MKSKKQWQRPQLLILGRGAPEEKVLLACKYNGATLSGPLEKNNCKQGNVGCQVLRSS